MMDAFKDFSATDWLFFSTMIIAWFHLVARAYGWLVALLIRRSWRWWNRKDEQTLALDSFYEVFKLADIKPGQGLVVTTESGMTIRIHRPREVRDA
ncbi:DUF4752 family protein [Lelliottia amnigena]|uniref:DUF4752 family protein n=1 Tax=Lelliottia amnigena TaxID=61646 RepID=UPI00209000BF|nr:DUF4752 family protein [Lelliottia amnigena]USR61608.1 DUF4752 family protein [Lelliottia amnigena]